MRRRRRAAPEPVWVAGETYHQWRKRREARLSTPRGRRWRMEYDLIYDGGGSDFIRHYWTRPGAKLASLYYRWIQSWGGAAKLYDNRNP